MPKSKMYAIPERFRKIENLHIVFWLLKDVSWALFWRPIGLFMLVPTLSVAFLITWQTRKLKSELFHNLAIVFWICANGFWMITEFFWPQQEDLRFYTVITFSIGLGFIIAYYFIILPTEHKKEKMVTIPVEVSEHTLRIAESLDKEK
jgi:prepilin signal peptidase PulO-like enzyme (type II secretory pathway)